MRTFLRPSAGGLTALLIAFISLSSITGCASTSTTATDDDRAADADTTTTDTTAASVVPREIPRTIPRVPAAQDPTANLDTVRAGRFDQGKMWTFEHPPIEYFTETYGFQPDDAWFEHARLGALRIPGCSASFVSPNGLVLTNHHCGRDHATSVSAEGENILDEGFYAENRDDERRVEELWADQLIEIRDVTDEMDQALAQAQTDAERMQAREEAIASIEERIGEEFGDDHLVQVISLYNGGLYSAYIFRHYTDVRLVMIPELDVGFFGGDPDNFTYPRYTLDMSLFRVYGDDGRPLESDTYFEWTDEGIEDGDAVFVIGNPGSTFRLSTVSQLAFRRDVEEGAVLDLISSRLDVLENYLEDAEAQGGIEAAADASGEADDDEADDEADDEPDDEPGGDGDPDSGPQSLDDLRNDVFSLQNAQKLYRGAVAALNDPVIFARREDAERRFVEAMQADPELRERYGGLFEEMEAIQQQKRELAPEMQSFLALSPQSILGSATLRRALIAHQYLRAREQGASGEEPLQQTLAQLEAVQDQPREVDERFLALRFEGFRRYFGEDDPFVQDVLGGREPEALAEDVIEGSALTTSESAAEALTSGTLTMEDPAVETVVSFAPRLDEFRSAVGGLFAQEEEIGSRLGRARYEIYGTDVPPDATFSLRIADGVVSGYPYNGTIAPPYTTIYGLYDYHYSHGGESPWNLPENWMPPPADLDLETPLNFVSTNDIIGGNSGSPVVNTDLELVGLVFDGNIESLSADFIYLSDRARAVNVDARGILEALDDVYEAQRIVQELETGRLIETEAEADAEAIDASAN